MRIEIGVAATFLALAARSAFALGGTATDQAVSLVYGPLHWSSSPIADLLGVDATGDPVWEAGWWYRAEGDTREFPMPAPDTESYVDGRIDAVWNDLDGKGFHVEEHTYVFDNEGPSGGFLSFMSVVNNTADMKAFTLFHYVDADLAGTSDGDSAILRPAGFIKFTDGASSAFYRVEGAVHVQVAAWPTLINLLNDTAAATLDDTGLPFGPGDATAAFQLPTWSTVPGRMYSTFASLFFNLHAEHVKGDFLGGLSFPPLYAQQADLTSPYVVLMRRTQQLGIVPVLGYDLSPPTPDSAIMGVDDFYGTRGDTVAWRDLVTGVVRVGASGPITGAPILPLNWKLSATGDFNADGTADILWRNTTSQKLVVWTMNGAAKTGAIVPTPDHAVDGNWEVAGAADFDGDGSRDLLWYNQTTGKIVLWYMSAALVRTTGVFTTPASVGNNNWRVVAVGDFGKGPATGPPPQLDTQDIVWQNDTSLKIVVWHMDHAAQRTGGVFTTPDSLAPGAHVVGPR